MVTPSPARYDQSFFDAWTEGSLQSARTVLPFVFESVVCKSVVDVGCGRGAWLRACLDLGIDDILGIDGTYVAPETLLIPRDRFIAADLKHPPRLERRFDVAVSLEVAEHLPPGAAREFVAYLTRLAPVVLFSAAIPDQGGTLHLNEKWPAYWAELFKEHGFDACDWLRPRLWNNEAVQWWYRQNIILFAADSTTLRAPAGNTVWHAHAGEAPPALVHPVFFQGTVQRLRTIERSRKPEQLPPSRVLHALLRSMWRHYGFGARAE